jgi:amidase
MGSSLTVWVRAGFAIVSICLLSGCSRDAPSIPTDTPEPIAPAIDVEELSATEARDRMAAGTLTSRALTQAYLDRIARIDDEGVMLNAVIEVSSTAVADAEALDAERKSSKVRSPLHGIPVLIKDNIDVLGMVNSAGSIALAENRPKRDAFLVASLREAGAVILGKANLSEWANFRSNRSTSGWSSRGGQTKNPYVLDRNPCGSSSGTAAAIASSLASVGVGTETDGSIICPAAVTALVGLKPTVGLVSRRGIIPISISQDTAGPMGRTVADVALLMNGMAKADERDPAGAASKNHIPADYLTCLKSGALKGKRFGVVRQAMGFHADADLAVNNAIDVMKAQGAEVIDVKIPTYNDWEDSELATLLYEFKDGLNDYLKTTGSPHSSLESLIAFNKANAERVMPFFGQEIFELAQAKGPLTDPAYRQARGESLRLAGRAGLLAALDRDRLDGLIALSTSPAWPTDYVLGDHFIRSGYSMAAVAGTPSITVPIGETRGLPIGLTIMGRAYSEPDLFGFAYAIEQHTKARKPPRFTPTVQ